ncbi:MAG: glucose-6-phosphate dehydrogenase [Planctomycetota bacterium]|nr:glucose-6-phosphate dehydrogenase [Planctomycetota bacterium]
MPNHEVSPCQLVIFGASGDLTKRKLIPSLYDLFIGKMLPEHFAVLGVSRTPMSDDQFRDHLLESARKFIHGLDEAKWREFAQMIYYHPGDSVLPEAFEGIRKRMAEVSQLRKTGDNCLLYLSMSPNLYEPTIVNIGNAGIVTEGKSWCSINRASRPWQRIIIEKPFGNDTESAAHLNRVLGRVFEEESIYRIDHYLGKETVQNLLVFRFANAIFEPIWNRTYIDHVQVTAAETVGVEGRGGYYDSPSGGAMRDMVQSHLLQVMAVVAMEPPVALEADGIRLEKSKIFRAARPIKAADVPLMAIRGQYGPGQMDGKPLPGYRQEPGVDPNSQTETYAALQLYVDTWRWGGVPFYLRSGKRMAKKLTEIVITFKHTPHALFREQTLKKVNGLTPNQIVINVQPNEGIRLRFEGKVPGVGMNIKSVVMDFDYVKQFNAEPPEAYATLLLDAIKGDQTLFKHRDEVEGAWRSVQGVIDYWKENDDEPLPTYASGTWGPSESDIMMDRNGRHWRNPT